MSDEGVIYTAEQDKRIAAAVREVESRFLRTEKTAGFTGPQTRRGGGDGPRIRPIEPDGGSAGGYPDSCTLTYSILDGEGEPIAENVAVEDRSNIPFVTYEGGTWGLVDGGKIYQTNEKPAAIICLEEEEE